jgi:hypothetical protein
MPTFRGIESGAIIDEEDMGANILHEDGSSVIDLGPGAQKLVSLHIVSANNSHVGDVIWEISNRNVAASFAANPHAGSPFGIAAATAYDDIEDNITTSCRYMRVRYARTGGAGTLSVFVNVCRHE